MWWYEGWNFTEAVLAPGIPAMIRRDYNLNIFPDCSSELFEVLDDTVLVRSFDLTFIAIGWADWDHDIVRGLILSNEGGKDHIRVGYSQVRHRWIWSHRY